MKVRIKFSKYGNMRFIGHLDVMRFFQKAFRRADIDIAFTEGMSPHMILSFANPLGLGLSGYGEYADAQLRTPITTEEALRRLNQVTVEGIDFLDFRRIEDGKSQKAMSLVDAADYLVSFKPGREPGKDWMSSFHLFMQQETIPFQKESKNGMKDVDLKSMVMNYEIREDQSIFLRLLAGSSANLRPELLLQAFAAFLDYEMPPFSLCVSRLDLYTFDEEGSCVSLNDLGTVITDNDIAENI